jgi:hypothetical protein
MKKYIVGWVGTFEKEGSEYRLIPARVNKEAIESMAGKAVRMVLEVFDPSEVIEHARKEELKERRANQERSE